MASQSKKTIAVIGLGNVGSALCHIFTNTPATKTSYDFIAAGHDCEDSINKLNELGIKIEITDVISAIERSDLCLLTVRDSQIEELCDLHSTRFKSGAIVAHCSGLLDSEILSSAKRNSGASICSLHPLTSFPTAKAAIKTLGRPQHSTYLYGEGDPEALSFCETLFNRLGFNSARIERDAKPTYHAACVFASNYLVSLIDTSLTVANSTGIDKNQFSKSIMPLVRATLSNIEETGAYNALSGPIVRGDADTVSKHIEVLSKLDSSLLNSYSQLGERALEISKAKGTLSESKIIELSKILKHPIKPETKE